METKTGQANKGLLILLKKRRLRLQKSDTKDLQFHYLLFGSFDAMQVKPINSWEDQLPSFPLDLEASGIYDKWSADTGIVETQDDFDFSRIPYVSSFILRALRPSINTKKLAYPDYMVPAPDKPFCALILINFTKKLCQSMESGNKLTKWMVNQLNNCPVVQNDAVECSLYESLGYYDTILLLRSRSPKPLEELSTYVRGLKKDGEQAVSSCYAALGLQNRDIMSKAEQAQYNEALLAARPDIEKVRISFQLQSSDVTPLHDIDRAEFLRSLNGYKDLTVSVPGDQSEILLGKYFSDGELNPGGRRSSILNADTHVYAANNIQPAQPGSVEAPPVKFDSEKDFWNTYRDYVVHRQRAYRSLRLATALRQTVIRFQNLVSSDHCFDLKKLIWPVFITLYQNMELANQTLDRLDARTADPESRSNLLHFWEEYDDAIKNFRDEVGRYISDLSLSDTHFIEDSHLKYPSIGTATKLLFVYQELIQKLASSVEKSIDKKDKYQFLVKSGGRDEPTVTNIFRDLWYGGWTPDTTDKDICYLLVIDMPETILYDIPTALFTLLHETFHMVGDRARKERAGYLCDAIASFVGDYLYDTYMFLRTPFSFDEYFRKFISTSELAALYKGGKATFQTGVTEKVREKLKQNIAAYSDEQYMSILLTGKLYKYCGELLSERESLDEILNLEHQALADAVEPLISKAEGKRQYPSRYIMVKRLLTDEITDESRKDSEPRRKRERFLNDIVSYLLGADTDVLDLFIDWLRKDYPKESDRLRQYSQLKMQEALDLCMGAMQEGFSDIMAIKTLRMKWYDYIISLISTTQNTSLDVMLPYTGNFVLRLGCVMECAFFIRGALKTSQKTLLTKHLKKRFPDDAVPNIIKRLDENLKIYVEAYGSAGSGNGIAPPICAYLSSATDALFDRLWDDPDSKYRQIAEDLRKFAAVKTTKSRKEQVMNHWLELAKEG